MSCWSPFITVYNIVVSYLQGHNFSPLSLCMTDTSYCGDQTADQMASRFPRLNKVFCLWVGVGDTSSFIHVRIRTTFVSFIHVRLSTTSPAGTTVLMRFQRAGTFNTVTDLDTLQSGIFFPGMCKINSRSGILGSQMHQLLTLKVAKDLPDILDSLQIHDSFRSSLHTSFNAQA